MESIAIGEVARRAAVASSAIRYCEAEGLVSSPERWGGKRAFRLDVVDRLVVIGTARERRRP